MTEQHTALVPRAERVAPAQPAMRELLTTVSDESSRTWVYRGFGLFVAWSVAIAAALIALVLPDRFTSRAQIYVNTDTLLRPLLRGLTVDSKPDEQVSIVQKTLLTDVNLSKVLLQGDEDLKVASRADLASAIEALRSQIRIDGVGNQLFSISFEGSAPERARQVVQSLLTIFIESNLGNSRTDMQTARDFLDQQIAANLAQLSAAGAKLTAFRADHINVLGQTDFSTRLSAARIALQESNAELLGAQQSLKNLRQRLQSTEPFVATDAPPAQIVVGDTLIITAIDRINTLRAQLQALRLRYTEDHPDVVAARDELAALVRQYSSEDDRKPSGLVTARGEPGTVHNASAQPQATVAIPARESAAPSASVSGAPGAATTILPNSRPAVLSSALPSATPGLANSRPAVVSSALPAATPSPTTPNPEYAEVKAQILKTQLFILEGEQKVARNQASLAGLEGEAKNAPPVEAELAELQREYDVAKKNYEDLLPRRESARMSQAVDTTVDVVQFRIVDPPTVPAKASGPNRNIILALGTLMALAGGAFAAFVRGTLAGAVVSARELSTTYGLPVIATIGSPRGALQKVRLSFQLTAVFVSILGIVVAMLVVAYALPSLEHYRFRAYEVVSQVFHL